MDTASPTRSGGSGTISLVGVPLDDAAPVIPVYARIAAALQENHVATYHSIGQNDLWIAASALEAGLPLLTRNRRHFGQIDGLTVIALIP